MTSFLFRRTPCGDACCKKGREGKPVRSKLVERLRAIFYEAIDTAISQKLRMMYPTGRDSWHGDFADGRKRSSRLESFSFDLRVCFARACLLTNKYYVCVFFCNPSLGPLKT